MKKIHILLLIVVSFFSCNDNVEFNNPAMQAKRNGDIWKAETYRANVDDNGRLRITGSFGDDNLTLLVTSTNLATYELGNTISEAIYNDGNATIYSTNNIPNPDVSIFEPDGKVEIYEYDRNNNYVSGRFNFNAYDVTGFKTINFNEGDFYRIPVTGEPIINTCNDATIQANSAETVFVNTGITDPNYTAVCTSYKNALLALIDACGDPDGSLILKVNNLGDCTVDTSDPCELAIANANSAKTAYDAILITDPNYPAICTTYKNALEIQINECEDPTGILKAEIDRLGDCMSDDNPDLCAIATANADAAKVTIDSVPTTDAQYPAVCQAYIDALENKILNCGDPGALTQTIIDGLGDCSVTIPGPTGSITVTFGTATLIFDAPVTVQQTGTTIAVVAVNGANQTTVSFDLEQNATGADIITNFMIGFGAGTYVPGATFTSNITTNDGTAIAGTFSGEVIPAGAGPTFELSNGVIDIMY